jgi:hypothetical protein
LKEETNNERLRDRSISGGQWVERERERERGEERRENERERVA